jgi:hypothetical protein
VQVAGARAIAEAFPEFQHTRFDCGGEGGEIGKVQAVRLIPFASWKRVWKRKTPSWPCLLTTHAIGRLAFHDHKCAQNVRRRWRIPMNSSERLRTLIVPLTCGNVRVDGSTLAP